MADAYDDLIKALNRLSDEVGDEVMSVTFSRLDAPVDWNEETQRWERGEANG